MHLLRIAHLAVWERPGEGPPILFTHATGFHGRVWDEIIGSLPNHCFSIDLRGHGQSEKDLPSKGLQSYAWRRFGEDTALVARELGLRDAIGAGHSLGGYAMALAASVEHVFSKLLLVDPVIYPPDWYDGETKDLSFIARRRARWKSVDEMFERFRGRAPFSAWNPKILRDYCEYGLIPDGHEFVLACPREIEAQIYQNSNALEADISAEVARIDAPATILRSAKFMSRDKFDLSASATDPNLATRMQNAEDVLLTDCSHLIPMEHPELIVDWLR